VSNNGAAQVGSALSRREIREVLLGAMVAMFLAALDQTIVAPALPPIARDLGEFNAISWVVTAYLLSSTAVTPIFGKLSDLYGRRRLLLAGLAIFIAGSIGCALAPSMVALIVARAVQGVGGGALLSLPNAVIGDVVSPRERGRYQGYFASVYALASVAGPVIGGVFAERLSWTLIFWVNLPLGLVAMYISHHALSRLPITTRPHQIDYAGSFLVAATTVCFLLAITWGGHRYPWFSPEIAMLLLAALVFMFLFLWRQRVAQEPLLPLDLLGNAVVRMTALIGMLLLMIYVSVSVYVPLFLELARGMRADAAGLVLIAPMISVVAGAVIAGQYMRFVGRYKWPPMIGTAVTALGLWTIAHGIETLSLTQIALLLAVVGVGLGTVFPTVLVACQNAVDPRDLGIATASHVFFRSLGGAIGVALFGAIILGFLRSSVALPTNADLTDILRPGALTPADLARAAQAFAAFFQAAAVASLLVFVGVALLKEIPLRQHSAAGAAAE
jgi:EmrB/QacA subfamily drug resistance transporter